MMRLFVALAVSDLLFFGGWIAREEMQKHRPTVKLPISGYDPRDLLSGHYVRFRLTAETEARQLTCENCIGGRLSVCLAPDADGLLRVSGFKTAEDHCAHRLTGERLADGSMRFGVDRFYVDERIAPQVPWVREGTNTYLLATLGPEGAVHPVDLVVEGRSIKKD